MARSELDPSHIMQIGMGFWASKTLLSAVELGLFTLLDTGPLTGPEIGAHLNLHPRAVDDFWTDWSRCNCWNATATAPTVVTATPRTPPTFLNRRSPDYIGGILEMANARLYGFWDHLTEALQTPVSRRTKPS